jgi:hypothetical protein
VESIASRIDFCDPHGPMLTERAVAGDGNTHCDQGFLRRARIRLSSSNDIDECMKLFSIGIAESIQEG